MPLGHQSRVPHGYRGSAQQQPALGERVAGPALCPRAHPVRLLEIFPIFLAGKGWEPGESGLPSVPQPLQQPGEVSRPVCPTGLLFCVPHVLLWECRDRQTRNAVQPGAAALGCQEPEPSTAQQSSCFSTPVKRGGNNLILALQGAAWGTARAGGVPREVTAAAVSLTRHCWQAGYGPEVLLACPASEEPPAAEPDLHPPEHQHRTGSCWDCAIRWGYS